MFIVKYYLLGAIAAFLAAYVLPHWYYSVIFIWIGLSLSLVSLAYITDKPAIFRKKSDGAIPFYVRWLFIPFLMGAQLYNAWARKNDSVPAIQEIIPNLYLACRLFPSDVDYLKQENVAAILDATAEFSGLNWSAQDNDLHYLNVPILDHKAPHTDDLVHAVNWIQNHVKNDRGVVVHCALGRGRSVLIVAAFLLANKHAKSVDEAMAMINKIRGTARLNSYQYKKLQKVLENGKLTQKSKLLLVANPVSGGGKWQTFKDEIEQLLGPYYDLETKTTEKNKNATEILNDTQIEKYELIIACGGDGTVNEVASTLIGTTTPLGIIPLGTTNALAHVLYGNGTKVNPVETACEALIQKQLADMDTAICNTDVMLLVTGLGFEQKMISNADRETKDESGEGAYLEALGHAFKQNETKHYQVRVNDGEEYSLEASSLVIANAAPFTTILAQGNGGPDPFDGELDVTILNTKESLILPLASLSMRELTKEWIDADDLEGVEHQKVKKIVIKADEELEFAVDGEIRKHHTVKIEVKPKSLKVIHNMY